MHRPAVTLRLRTKLAATFASVIGLAIAAGAVALSAQFHTRDAIHHLVDNEVRVADLALESKSDLGQARRYEREFLARPRSLDFEEVRTRYVTLAGAARARFASVWRQSGGSPARMKWAACRRPSPRAPIDASEAFVCWCSF